MFSIDSEGVVRVLGEGEETLPYDQYTLLISAVDGGSPSLESSVPVFVNLEPKLGLVSNSLLFKRNLLGKVLFLDFYTFLEFELLFSCPTSICILLLYFKVAASKADDESELNMIIVIVLGVICGLLLVIVIILLIYIYKK